MKIPFLLIIILTMISQSSCEYKVQNEEKRPNFIIIQADDLGFDDLPINGNRYVDAPNIDKIADEGVYIKNFLVNPVCAASRASLLTGRDFLLTGVSHVHGGKDFLNLSEKTFGDIFKEEGYATGVWGKWHSGKTEGYFPWERGFDEAYMAELYIHENSVGLFNGKPVSFNKWSDEVIVDYAIDFMKRNEKEPFLAYLSFLNVHAPLAAKETLIQSLEAKGLSRNLATLYAMIEQMDAQVGRILDAVNDLDINDNTVVIFLSDNGPAILNGILTDEDRQKRYSGDYKGHKGNIWNNGVKSPLFIKYPKELKPRKINFLADITDVFPTIAEIASIDLSKYKLDLTGTSFWDCLQGNKSRRPNKSTFNYAAQGWPPSDLPWTPKGVKNEYAPTPEKFIDSVLQFDNQIISYQNEDFKLLKNASSRENDINNESGYCLIETKSDPYECKNVIGKYPEIFESMEKKLFNYYQDIVEANHSFQAITFNLSKNNQNCVLLYAPKTKSNELKIAYNYSYAWNTPGLFASYNVRVLNDFIATPIITGANIPAETKFTIEIAGEKTASTSSSGGIIEFAPISLKKGIKEIRIILESLGETDKQVQLFELFLASESIENQIVR